MRAVAGEPAEAIASAVVHAARTFAERLHDDVAVVVLRVPENLGFDPIERVVLLATGVPADALVLPNTKRAANRVVVRTPASIDGDTATCTLLPSNFGSAVRTRAVSQTP